MTAASAVFLALAVRIPESPRAIVSGSLLVPVVSAALMLAFALAGLVLPARERKPSPVEPVKKAGFGRGAAIVLLIVYALVLETAGFPLATFVLLFALSPFFGLNGFRAAFSLSLAATAGIWLFFTRALGAYLPPGTLFP